MSSSRSETPPRYTEDQITQDKIIKQQLWRSAQRAQITPEVFEEAIADTFFAVPMFAQLLTERRLSQIRGTKVTLSEAKKSEQLTPDQLAARDAAFREKAWGQVSGAIPREVFDRTLHDQDYTDAKITTFVPQLLIGTLRSRLGAELTTPNTPSETPVEGPTTATNGRRTKFPRLRSFMRPGR